MITPSRSLSEVAAILGIDRRQVWHIEKAALAKLRKKLAHLETEAVPALVKKEE